MDATAVIKAADIYKALFLGLASLELTAYKYPENVDVLNNAKYDYIVVGGGTAGCSIATRLSEDPKVSVLLIEEGNNPERQTEIPALVPYYTGTVMDRNYTSENDGYTAQYQRNKGHLSLPSGLCLGGSSTIDYSFYVRGYPSDYDEWAKAAGDNSWSWSSLRYYFMKSERMEDEEILASGSSRLYGQNGYVGIEKETRKEPLQYIEAFNEGVYSKKQDISETLGYSPSLYTISKGIRQTSAESYLQIAKRRPNLDVMRNAQVTKVLFDENMNAIGVKCRKPNGKVITISARLEIILSAGVFGTAKILMSSGVGPKEHLETMGIKVLYDSPNVGKNLKGHAPIILVHVLKKVDETAPPLNPKTFPVSTFTGMCALNKSQNFPDYFTTNFICKNLPLVLLHLSSVMLGLNVDVCNQLAAAGERREVLFTMLNKARPASLGEVLLSSSNFADPPRIFTGHFSSKVDLKDSVLQIKDFLKVKDSSYFQRSGGKLLPIYLPQCKDLKMGSTKYWECYILSMMDTNSHYTGTCRLGSVVNSRLQVMGTNRLRVGDASVMPNPTSGKPKADVLAIAEKLADMVKEDNSGLM